MNLRQKVKKAKRELAILKDQPTLTQWDMWQNYENRRKLNSIIDLKKKSSRYYHWNEKYEIDWKKLTYIAVYADFDKLAELKSPNGKPLNPKLVDEFIDLVIRTKFYDYAKKVSEMEWRTNKGIDTEWEKRRFNMVTYSLTVSNDRTKQKRFHSEPVFYQVRGEDKLHKPQNRNDKESE